VNRERFAGEGAIYQRPAPLTIADFRDWLREAQDYYRYIPGGVDERTKALAKSIELAKAEVALFKKNAPPGPESAAKAAALEKRLVAAEQKVAQFSAKGWVQKDRRSGAVEKGAAEISEALASIKADSAVAQGPHVLQDLWNARNDKTAIKLKAVAEVYKSLDAQDCIRLTVTPDQDCYLVILVRDSEGNLSVLLPNRDMKTASLAVKQQPWILDQRKFEVPVLPPYGKMTFKVIATSFDTGRLTFPDAKLAPSGFYEKLTALGTENVSRKKESSQALVPPADWAVAETEIVTKAPGGQ